jgi:uncharacterized damage-inducible protein DinB
VLDVVAHIVGAEWIWLRRCKGESPTRAPDWFSNPSPPALMKALEQVEGDRLQFLLSLASEDLDKEVGYSLLDGSKGVLPLSTLFRHVMNHSTYHRGQLAAMLRRLNVTPPSTDLMIYAAERRVGSENAR